MRGAIILVGMMGVGKTTLGRRLAELLEWDFKDTDKLLTQKLGRGIPQLFSIYGEDAFREHETSILRGLEPGPYVLATGGGIVTRAANWNEFRRLGLVIFLDVPVDILVPRLAESRKRRPLLETENPEERIRELAEKRRALYQQADVIVPLGDQELDDAAEAVITAMEAAL